jgi:hypothetical protein
MASIIDEATARYAASEFIHVALGSAYALEQGFLRNHPSHTAWRFLVLHREYDAVAGYVDVDAETSEVIPLDDEQLQDLRERALVVATKSHNIIARDEDGYILPFLAKIQVNGYLSSDVAFFASAKGQPVFVDGNPLSGV